MGIIAVTLVLLGGLALSCSTADKAKNSPGTVVGRIQIIGNEPFTSVAVEVGDGRMYILSCEKVVESQLRRHQGQLMKIHFRGTEIVPEGTALLVVGVESVGS